MGTIMVNVTGYNIFAAYDLNPHAILQVPSYSHIFGTDRLGWDVLARVLISGQTSLIIEFLSAAIVFLTGLFLL